MTLRVAIQMDDVASINPRSDTTLRLGLEANRRGYDLWYYTPDTLSFRDGRVSAQAARITFHDNVEHYYDASPKQFLDLHEMDVVLLRQDPPFNMAYVTSTYHLEALLPRTRVFNHPASVRDLPEKWFPTLLPHFSPPTLVTSQASEIERFAKDHKDVVIKPFYGHGGRSVFRTGAHDTNFYALVEMLAGKSGNPMVVQPFLPEVREQDKRIVMINGQVEGVLGRIPAASEIRANMRVGGEPVKSTLSPKQEEICAALSDILIDRGIMLAGVDVIGDWLTEVNITSPTGFVPINRLYNTRLEAVFWDAVEAL